MVIVCPHIETRTALLCVAHPTPPSVRHCARCCALLCCAVLCCAVLFSHIPTSLQPSFHPSIHPSIQLPSHPPSYTSLRSHHLSPRLDNTHPIVHSLARSFSNTRAHKPARLVPPKPRSAAAKSQGQGQARWGARVAGLEPPLGPARFGIRFTCAGARASERASGRATGNGVAWCVWGAAFGWWW